jgi:uncharacterized protein (TIGR03435 family)
MRLAAILTLLAGSVIASAQSASPPANAVFEVASVKLNNSGNSASSSNSRPGSFIATNVQLRLLIAQAYGVRSNRLAGPNWIDTTRYDINARAPENTPGRQINLMLRALLVDRFKLVARTETRDQPVYALVKASKDDTLGPSLRLATECDKKASLAGGPGAPGVMPLAGAVTGLMPCGTRSTSNPAGSLMTGGAITMADFARNLDGPADRLVVDRTGLTGTYNVELRFARPNVQAAGQESELPVLFTAVQEQLGLKLESARGPVEFLVVDRIEQPAPD